MKNIALIGFMGTGKSVVGKLLAKKIAFEYFDVDKHIEQESATTITDIFATKGEQYFRELETAMIEKAAKKNKVVIATGGGAVLRSENMNALESSSVVLCLRAKPETIFERIKDDTKRPLLKVADPLLKIKVMLENREKNYARCAFFVNTDEISVNEVVEKIIDKLVKEYNFKV